MRLEALSLLLLAVPAIALVYLFQAARWRRIADGYDTVLVVSLGFAVLGVATMACFVPFRTGAVRRTTPRREPRPRLRWRTALTPGLVRVTGVSGVLALLTVGDGFVYLALLETGGFAAQWFPVLYVGTNLAYLALAVPLGRLADRVGRVKVLVLGHLPLVGAYLCAATGSGALVATTAAVLLLGVFYAATDGTLAAVAGRLVPESLRASGIATAQTAVAVARLLAACPDLAIRNGARALELGLAAWNAQPIVPHAETVALAWAELGRCEEAARWEQTAIDVARKAGFKE